MLTLREVNDRLSNGYQYYKGGAIYVRGVADAEKNLIACDFFEGAGAKAQKQYIALDDFNAALNLESPPPTLHSSDYGLLYIQLLPLRVNRMNINSDMIDFRNLTYLAEREVGVQSPNKILPFFLPKMLTLEQIRRGMESGKRVGGALTNEVGIGLSINDRLPLVFYQTQIVGSVDFAQRRLFLKTWGFSYYQTVISEFPDFQMEEIQ